MYLAIGTSTHIKVYLADNGVINNNILDMKEEYEYPIPCPLLDLMFLQQEMVYLIAGVRDNTFLVLSFLSNNIEADTVKLDMSDMCNNALSCFHVAKEVFLNIEIGNDCLWNY